MLAQRSSLMLRASIRQSRLSMPAYTSINRSFGQASSPPINHSNGTIADAEPETVPVRSTAPSAAELLDNRAATHRFDKQLNQSISDLPIESGKQTGEQSTTQSPYHDQLLPHPLWTKRDLESIRPTHRAPHGIVDRLAYYTIKIMRFNFDWMSGWNRTPEVKRSQVNSQVKEQTSEEIYEQAKAGVLTPQNRAIDQALSRIMFLETVAGIPGSIAGMLRHLASLRRMRRDNGWINMLLGEAENERMHLLTATQLKQPSRSFRALVWLTQGVFFNWFWICYLISPRYCHRMVGYLEEEATLTYTKIIERIDDGTYLEWQTQPAPLIAVKYWKMSPDSTMRDVICVIRADEAHHRDVNHHFADIPRDALAVYSVKALTEHH